MSERELETHFIFAIISVAFPFIIFLIAFILSLRERRRRKAEVNEIREEMINPEKRKNGKH